MKESKICSYQAEKFRLQLIMLNQEKYETIKYQVRLNRKIIDTSINEYTMRKLFALYVQNHVLQLKIF